MHLRLITFTSKVEGDESYLANNSGVVLAIPKVYSSIPSSVFTVLIELEDFKSSLEKTPANYIINTISRHKRQHV